MSHVETYTYDELGEKVTQTDANKHVTSFAYDQKGHVIQKTLPAAQTMSSSYNPDGTLASTTDYNGQTVAMEYDSAGRLIAKHDGTLTGTVLASFVYSTADGSLTSKSKGNVTTSYAYDSLGRTSSVTTSNSGSGGISSAVSYTYDAASNKKTQATSSATLTYDYDADERLTAVHSASALDETSATIIATYSYDPAGNRKSLVRSNGVATSYQYDDLNRLTQITNEQQGSTTPISSYQYDLSPSGKRLSVTDQSKAVTGYAYDDDGRLIEEKSAAAGDAVYGYDAVGNRLSKSVSGTVTQSLHYDADDRVIGYGYDANGNVLNDGVRSYAWDWENKLINSGVAGSALYSRTYVYDANGLRVQQAVKSNVTNYVVDTDSGFGNVVEERDGSDNLLLRYDYGDDLVRMDRTDGEYYYLYDGLGSTRQLTDSSGGAITGDSYNYDAFGNLSTVSTSSTEMLFDGQEQDGTGLYYLRARYMDPTRGEFLGQDPFEGDDEDPVTLHRYVYANIDPVDVVDPSGQDGELVSLGVEQIGSLEIDSVSQGATIGAKVYAAARLVPLIILLTAPLVIATGYEFDDSPGLPVLYVHVLLTPHIAANINIALFLGKPDILTWDRDPGLTKSRRVAALGPYKAGASVPDFASGIAGSWDEYPFAATVQGGAGAYVSLVPRSEQFIQGGQIKYFLYDDPNGLHGIPGDFQVDFVP